MTKNLINLALPMVVGQLAFASMGFIDTVLLGQLGVKSLAGGALGSMVFQFFHIVGIGVLAATANLIAFEYGKKNEQGIHTALLSGVCSVFILTILFGLVVANAIPLLLLMGQDSAVLSITEQYLEVIVWALFPAFGFILLRSLALGLGDSSAILPVSIVAAGFNYPVSHALMTGSFGLPALGVRGVALGTLIVAIFMVVSMAILIYRRKGFHAFPFWSGWSRFSVANLVETYRLGLQIAIAHAMEIGMFSAAALLVGAMSAEALAAHQIVLQCVTLSFMIPLGLSQAVSVKVGKYYGAGDPAAVREIVMSGIMIATLTATAAGLIFWLAPETLVEFFVDESVSEVKFNELLATATAMLFVGAMFQLVDGWQVVLMGALRGFKLGGSPTAVATISFWGLGFPAAYFLGEAYGPVGVWGGMGLGLGLSAVLLSTLAFRTYQGFKRRVS